MPNTHSSVLLLMSFYGRSLATGYLTGFARLITAASWYLRNGSTYVYSAARYTRANILQTDLTAGQKGSFDNALYQHAEVLLRSSTLYYAQGSTPQVCRLRLGQLGLVCVVWPCPSACPRFPSGPFDVWRAEDRPNNRAPARITCYTNAVFGAHIMVALSATCRQFSGMFPACQHTCTGPSVVALARRTTSMRYRYRLLSMIMIIPIVEFDGRKTRDTVHSPWHVTSEVRGARSCHPVQGRTRASPRARRSRLTRHSPRRARQRRGP